MTDSNSSLIVGMTTWTSASNGRSFSSSIDEAISGNGPWKLPSVYQRPTGIFAAVCQSGGVFTSPRPTSSTARHRAVVRPHVQLDVRRRKRRRPRARQRVDLVVMMAVEDAVGVGGQRRVRRSRAARSRRHGRSSAVFSASPSHSSSNVFVPAPRYATPSISAVWQTRQFTVQRSGVDRPRSAFGAMPNAGTRGLSRHSDQPDLVADDRVHVADDGLRDEVAVEQRLRNPRRGVVGLVHEVEQRLPALGFGPRIRRIPRDRRGSACPRRSSTASASRDDAAPPMRASTSDDGEQPRSRAASASTNGTAIESRVMAHLLSIRESSAAPWLRLTRSRRRASCRHRRIGQPVLVERARRDRRRDRRACRARCGRGPAPSRATAPAQRGVAARARRASTSFSATSVGAVARSASAPLRRPRAAADRSASSRESLFERPCALRRPAARSAVLPASSHSSRLRG